jgi:hypothetical protein
MVLSIRPGEHDLTQGAMTISRQTELAMHHLYQLPQTPETPIELP